MPKSSSQPPANLPLTIHQGKIVVERYPTPNLADRIYVRRMDARVEKNKIPPIVGSVYDGPDPKQLEGFVFATARPADQGGFVDWFYLNERANQDAYNFSVDYPYNDKTYPRLIRTYVLLREGLVEPQVNTLDPIFPGLQLTDHKQTRIEEDPVLDSLFVMVQRVYETLPSPIITTVQENQFQQLVTVDEQELATGTVATPSATTEIAKTERTGTAKLKVTKGDTDDVFGQEEYVLERNASVIPYKWQAFLPSRKFSQVTAGIAVPPVALAPGEWRAVQKQLTKYKKLVETVTHAFTGLLTLVSYLWTRDQQIATVTETWSPTLQTITPRATLIDAEVDNWGEAGSFMREVEVPSVFPGDIHRIERPDVTPEKFRAAIPTKTEGEELAGNAVLPTLTVGQIAASEEQTTELKKRISLTSRTDVGLPFSLVGKATNDDKQTVTRTETLQDGNDAQAIPTALQNVQVENLGDGRVLQTVDKVPDVFPGPQLSVEIPDPVPPEFRNLSPTTTVAATVEGSVELPELETGETAKSESQLTEFTKRIQVTGRDPDQLPVTLTDQKTSGVFGFGGVMDVERTLDAAPQTVDEGIFVVGSTVRDLGKGLTLKETEAVSGSGSFLTLTDGGSGYTSPPVVSFSGGAAPGGATATAQLSTLPPGEYETVNLAYQYDGDTYGVFHFLGELANNGTWTNPHTAGKATFYAPYDTLELGTFASIVDRRPSNTYLALRDHAELWFSLGDSSLKCRRISYRQRADYGSPARDFSLQGSNDGGSTWSSSFQFDVLGSASVWTSKGVTQDAIRDTAFNLFRLIIPIGDDFLSIGELELYGALTYLPAAVAGDKVVISATVTAGGTYLSAPDVVFSGGGGTGAQGDATLDENGAVTAIQITSGGTGYVTAPTVSFSGGVGTDSAIATATVSKTVTSVSLTAGGSGYLYPPSVSFSGGGGGGAAAVAVLGFGVASITLLTPGSGYTSPPTVGITGDGTGATATATLSFGVASVAVDDGGSGYTTAPAVVFSGSGTGAAANAVLGYPLDSLTWNANGSGYTTAPTAAFSGGGGSGSGAAATVQSGLTGISSVTMSDGGSGWGSDPSTPLPPTVAFTGGGGTGAAGTAVLDQGVGGYDDPLTPGTGYTSVPTATISGGGGSGATAQAYAGADDAATVVAGGSGYTAGDYLTVSGGTAPFGEYAIVIVDTVDGGGAVLTAHVWTVSRGSYTVVPANAVAVTGGDGTGATFNLTWRVVALDITAAGTGYTSIPTLAFSASGGSGAAATLYTDFTVASVTMTNPGSGYTSAPAVSFSPQFIGGYGGGATGTAVVGAFVLTGIVLTSPGNGYTSAPTITLSGGGGTGAAATAIPETTGVGIVSAINITSAGTGYQTPPTISFTGGGGGVDAAATATLLASGRVAGFVITAPGTGYTSTPAVSLSGGSGTGATGSANLSTSGTVLSITLTHPGAYQTTPTISLSGGLGSGATATAVLSTTGTVTALTLVVEGDYLTAPTVIISGGSGSGAAGVYMLSSAEWPILFETRTDPTDGIVVNMVKSIVPAGTLYPGTGYVDIDAVDKWRSIQIVSSIDLSTLPGPITYATMHPLDLPDLLLSVTALWADTTNGQAEAVQDPPYAEGTVLTACDGDIVVQVLAGYKGYARAVVTRSFFAGPPQLANIPAATIIRPALGTATLFARSHSFKDGLGENRLVQSNSRQLQITSRDVGPVLTGLYQVFGESHVSTPVSVAAGDVNTGVIIVSIPGETGTLEVAMPVSTPGQFFSGDHIVFVAPLERWRFGIYVQEVIRAYVP